MQTASSLRASDADRESVAQRLRHATAEGRLNTDELEDRLQALFAARTYGELDALLADLPAGRCLDTRRVRGTRWFAVVGAFTLVLAALALARLHSVAAGVVGGPARGRHLSLPGPLLGQIRFRPPLADPNQGLIVAVSMVGVLAVLLVCSALLWLLMRSRTGSGP
jgi:Domain of unknown function (DUF1707)